MPTAAFYARARTTVLESHRNKIAQHHGSWGPQRRKETFKSFLMQQLQLLGTKHNDGVFTTLCCTAVNFMCPKVVKEHHFRLSSKNGCFSKIRGTSLGVPIIRIIVIVYWGSIFWETTKIRT